MRSTVKIVHGYIPDTWNLISELCIYCSLYKKTQAQVKTKNVKLYQPSSALKPLGFLIFENIPKSIKTAGNDQSIKDF